MLSNYEMAQAAKIASSFLNAKDSEDQIEKAEELSKEEKIEINKGEFYLNNSILKAKSTGFVGEIREFGGRNYIKTTSGWKYHGKGTGAKAKEHSTSTTEPVKEKIKVEEASKEQAKTEPIPKKESKKKYNTVDYRDAVISSHKKHNKEQEKIFNEHELSAKKQNESKGRYETSVSHYDTYADEARKKYGLTGGNIYSHDVAAHLRRKELDEKGLKSPHVIGLSKLGSFDVKGVSIKLLSEASEFSFGNYSNISIEDNNKKTAAYLHQVDEQVEFIESYQHWSKINKAIGKEIANIKKAAEETNFKEYSLKIALDKSDDLDFDKHTINFTVGLSSGWQQNNPDVASVNGIVKFDNEGNVKTKISKQGLLDALDRYEKKNNSGDLTRNDTVNVEFHKKLVGGKIKLPEASEKSKLNQHLKSYGYQQFSGNKNDFSVISIGDKLALSVSNTGKKDHPSTVLSRLLNHSKPSIPGYTVDYSKVIDHAGKTINAEKYKKDYMKSIKENDQYSEYEISMDISYPITKNKK